MRPAATPVPAYALYGEAQPTSAVDPLHWESIAERSRLHDWEIRPHRHERLFQLLLVRRGRAQVTIDGRSSALAGPALVTVPAGVAHGFRFAPSIDGLVFTVAERHLHALLAGAADLRAALARPQAHALQRGAPAAQALLAAADALRTEMQGHGRWRAQAIDAALLALAVAAARALPDAGPAPEPGARRAQLHVERFRALVEAEYRRQPTLAALAARLGITPTQLNRVCQRVLGRPALDVLHARLALEAQRELAYTAMSVKQIALGLGFADAAYFTRFFRRRAGATPTAWRVARSAIPTRG